MKLLFCVKNNQGKVYGNAFFEKKTDAKGIRNELNKEGGKLSPYTVGLGPDHKNFSQVGGKKSHEGSSGHKQGVSTGNGFRGRG